VLPRLHDEDLALFAAALLGTATVVLASAAVVPVTDVPVLAVLLVLGAGLVAGGLDAANVGASATVLEALALAGVGALLARGLLAPALALSLPLVVAVVDLFSTSFGGPSELLGEGVTKRGDPLSLGFADWGTQMPAGRLGISDAVFCGVFLLYARRFGLRFGATAVGLWVGMIAAVVLRLWLGVSIPVLPAMAIAYYLVNADRLPRLARQTADAF
jgi:hypothetical protein